MFDDTLIIWGGEFGRTIYSQGGLTKENYGRDHHPRCFSMWMAGGGSQRRRDLRRDRRLQLQHRQRPAPHQRLPRHRAAPARLPRRPLQLQFQGLDAKLIGVNPAKVVKALLAGVIRRSTIPPDLPGMPEAIELWQLGCPITLTFETPSEFSFDDRVQTQAEFVSAAIRLALPAANHLP
jgi:hypothetical protein